MIWHMHTDYSKLHPYLWILMCLPWFVWEVEEWNGTDFSLLHFPAIWLGFWKYFAKTNHSFTSLQDLSCRSLCIYILTKALFLFTLLLKMAYVELMVGEMEAYTCVTCIAKSNNESMEMTTHTSWSRLCTCVEGGWWKWNTPLMNLSLLYLDNMRTWLY